MKPATVEDYLASVTPETQRILQKIRTLVKHTVPDAQETISYGIPAFKLDRTFIYFAGFKKHIGIYPPVKGDRALAKALLPYRGEKGNLQFPLDKPLPYELIGRVAAALARQYSKR